MKRWTLSFFVSVLLVLAAPAAHAALRFVVINGTNGSIIASDLAARDRPTVTRLAAGSYRLVFPSTSSCSTATPNARASQGMRHR